MTIHDRQTMKRYDRWQAWRRRAGCTGCATFLTASAAALLWGWVLHHAAKHFESEVFRG